MISILIVIIAGALGAFFYRCRGGFISLPSTFLARLVWWAFPCAVAALAADLCRGGSFLSSFGTALTCGLCAYLGLLIPHGKWMAAATGDEVRMLSLIGAARCALIAAPLAIHAHAFAFLPLFGALMGPLYRHAQRFLAGIDSGIMFRGQVFAKGGTEWGEVLTGAAIGFGFSTLCLI